MRDVRTHHGPEFGDLTLEAIQKVIGAFRDKFANKRRTIVFVASEYLPEDVYCVVTVRPEHMPPQVAEAMEKP